MVWMKNDVYQSFEFVSTLSKPWDLPQFHSTPVAELLSYMMLFFFAGRSIVIVLLTFSFVGSSPSRPHSRLVHVFQQREVTITDQVTKTVFTTDNVTSSFITSLSHHRSTSVSSSSPFSSALSSITETSFLSSSFTTSRAYVLIIAIC